MTCKFSAKLNRSSGRCWWPCVEQTCLKHSDDGPEQRVKILAVRHCVSIPLRAKLTTKQVHAQNTVSNRVKDFSASGKITAFTADALEHKINYIIETAL